MKAMILSETSFNPIIVKIRSIRRTKVHDVITRNEEKIYRPMLQKRKFFMITILFHMIIRKYVNKSLKLPFYRTNYLQHSNYSIQ